MRIKIGCSGFPISKKKYFEHFKVVEIQQTFYQPPERKVIENWAKERPPDFEYVIKAWQLITHSPESPTYRRLKDKISEEKKHRYGFFRPTEEVFLAWQKIEEIAKSLNAKIVLFQTPQSFIASAENKENIKRFFSTIRRDFIFGVELRGWRKEDIEIVCKDLDLVHVVDPFLSKSLYGAIGYFRLHGKGGYRYRYSREELLLLKDYLPLEKENYVFFNNTYMFENAVEFKEIMNQS